MDVIENGTERRRPPHARRLVVGALVVVGLGCALMDHALLGHHAGPVSPASAPDPMLSRAAAALPVQPGTRAVQALAVRAEHATSGLVRLPPGEYTIDVVCLAPTDRVSVEVSSGPAVRDLDVACAPSPTPVSTGVESDPAGLTITVSKATDERATIAWRATRL
jgi:hypothetical protein